MSSANDFLTTANSKCTDTGSYKSLGA